MRHAKARLQLNRFTSWRKATLISLARAMIIHQQIKTTLHRAKAAKPLVEELISLGKKNSLFAKRQAYKILGSHKLVSLLFKDIAPRFTNRIGGYTRILNLGVRRGDNAQLAILALTEIKEKKPKKIQAETPKKTEIAEERPLKEEKLREEKSKTEIAVKEKPPITKKPTKKFLGGLRGIFKKERDSL
ncbi:MAG: 50S ribosomal protein L17 [Candidatus Omnitrophica bacterium]|nr:50S ribosomal protein L17 [Candidatus Omnitrophota bacterium]MDD5591766.1 50S ribosomal protein L17 [Candidatus Omnitrophota bacterium]